jgi:hypothetical protein
MKPPTKPSVCMTCYVEVEWAFDDKRRVWVPYQPGTKKVHQCKEKE